MHTRLQPVILAVVLAASLAAASCSSKTTTIAIVPKSQAHVFWRTVRAGAERCAEDARVKTTWGAPASETDFAGQAGIVDGFISQHVDAIVLAPSHRKTLIASAERAVRAGIPVVIIDSALDFGQAVSFVATDNYQGGVAAARRMGGLLDGHGTVAILGIAAGAASGIERESGFQDTIRKEYPDIKIVEYQFTGSDRAKGLTVTEDILGRFPTLNGLFASNEPGAAAAAKAVTGHGLRGKVRIVGFDTAPDLIQGVRDGTIDALVAQQPFKMGCEGVRAAVAALRHQAVEKRIDTGTLLVTHANLDSPEVQELLAPRGTQAP